MLKILSYVAVIILLPNYVCTQNTSNYSRDLLAEKHPGFGKEWIYYLDQCENPKVVQLEPPSILRLLGYGLEDIAKYITFYLYTRKARDGLTISTETLNSSQVDFSKDFKFVVHGYLSSASSDTCEEITNAYLDTQDVNIIVLDWQYLANSFFYFTSAGNTPSVGYHLAKLLDALIQHGANSSKFHLIGHSLGAHISGYAGKHIKKGKIGRITGLDPALPAFDGTLLTPLGCSDATFVDIIHTCGNFLGIHDNLGHADFYPNGGMPPQPGCNAAALLLQMIEGCSHGRSWQYFAESIYLKNQFWTKRCKSWDDYKNNNCDDQKTLMGDPSPTTAKGNYYLVTKSEAPFSISADEN